MSKVETLRKAMSDKGLDAVVVFDELNQRYLSDFAFTDGLLLITMQRAFLITDFRYYEMGKNSASADFEVIIPDNRREFITKTFEEDGCLRVGFEGSYVSYDRFSALKYDYPSVEFENIGNVIELQRMVKDDKEIKFMQKAQDITDAAFSHILKVITPDMTEIEVAAELEYAMRRGGADGLAFETIAVSGDASSLPHGTPRNVKLKKGFLTMDFGAKFEGYCSDMTRTIVIGKADAEIKKLYNTVLDAQMSALAFLKCGADASDADKVARDIIDSHPEFKGTFGHSLGHGVGLFIHESPRLSGKATGNLLRIGEVVTVEPGIYLYGKYGCRIEDMVKIEKNGVYNFTKSTKELIEIL